MKKSILSLAVVMASVGLMQAKGNSDPVLMTVNGKPVTLSEFEYLYHKNNSQQMAPQTIEEYLDMFVTYKQKVADAEAEGIDKTDSFRNEFDGYRRELAEPYMRDQAVEDSIIASIYERMKEERDVSYILRSVRAQDANLEEERQRLDSVRTALLGGADFAEMAVKYSQDRAAARNQGHMGWIAAGRLPSWFEEKAYDTAVGEISPVFETPVGLFIVKVNGRRPASGVVQVAHILKLTQGLSDEEAARKKQQIDSIYTLVANGADFEDIATRESEDPGSARNGGKMSWFGIGQMVPEFETASYSLKNGEISKPVQTSYGWHIIKRINHRDIEPFDEAKVIIKKAIDQDPRGDIPRQRKLEQLYAKYGVKFNEAAFDAIKADIARVGTIDSTLHSQYKNSDQVLVTVMDNDITLADAMADIPANPVGDETSLTGLIRSRANGIAQEYVLNAERDCLAQENPNYRNLLNEYRDGILLFEVADRKVWSKAKQDREGLEAFFEKNRDKYRWENPKYKGYVIFATNDSILQEARNYLTLNNVANDSISNDLRRQFGKDIKVEKVVAAKGENAITDYLGFGSEEMPEPKGKWVTYFGYRDKLIDAPEEAGDVRGAVTGDYQAELERQWIEYLKKKYPVKIKHKVLKQAK